MSLSLDRRNAISVAVAAGTAPTTGRSGQTNLRLRQIPGRSSYSVLSRADGSLTAAGDFYYAAVGGPPPSRQFNQQAEMVQKGSSDYIMTRSGELALVRRLRPDGSSVVTRLGKLYFRTRRSEYVVSVPATISGTNTRGRTQSRRTLLPVSMFGIGRILADASLSEQSRVARVKSHVLEKLAIRTSGGASVLMEISGEVFTYDRTGDWLISRMTTEIQDGEAVTSAVLRQPLGAAPLSCAAFLPFPDCIVESAFESHDDKL